MEGVAARTLGRVTANGLELADETFGDPGAPPVVLIMGLATQMIAWPDELCEGLAWCGLFVVRSGNRDVGESTHLRDLPPPRLAIVVRRRPPSYPIGDMAADVAGLIDGLGLGEVHWSGRRWAGSSRRPSRSRCCPGSHPHADDDLYRISPGGAAETLGLRPAAAAARGRRPAAAIAAAVETFRLIGSHGFAFDEQYVREVAGRSWDRGYDPDGYRRQRAASASQPNRTADLRRITVPALVIHGLNDPLVAPGGGLAIARAIPGSASSGFRHGA